MKIYSNKPIPLDMAPIRAGSDPKNPVLGTGVWYTVNATQKCIPTSGPIRTIPVAVDSFEGHVVGSFGNILKRCGSASTLLFDEK